MLGGCTENMIKTVKTRFRRKWTAATYHIRKARQRLCKLKRLLQCVDHQKVIPQAALACFSLFERVCCQVYIHPFHRNTATGRLELRRLRGLCLHYISLLLFGFNLAHKATAAVHHVILHGLLELETMLCIGLLITFFTGSVLLLGPVLRAGETVRLLNALEQPLEAMGKHTGRKVSLYGDTSSSLRIIFFAVLAFLFTSTASFSFICPDLRSFIVPLLTSLGLLPAGPTLNIIWRILFFPVEYIALAVPVSTAAYTTNIGHLLIGVCKTYWAEMGTIPIENVESRKFVERLYIQLQLLNAGANSIVRHMLPYLAVAAVSGIVTSLFIFLRHQGGSTGSELMIRSVMGSIGILCVIVMMWMTYDALAVLRLADDVRVKLNWKGDPALREMAKLDRLGFLKRAAALRPFFVPVGPFTNFSLEVIIAVWEEIPNQLLWLLSY